MTDTSIDVLVAAGLSPPLTTDPAAPDVLHGDLLVKFGVPPSPTPTEGEPTDSFDVLIEAGVVEPTEDLMPPEYSAIHPELEGETPEGWETDNAGGGEVDPTPDDYVLVITSPTEGATVAPIHDVSGSGAPAGAPGVTLWYSISGSEFAMVDTTDADPDGNFMFAGGEAAAVGPLTWQVRFGEYHSLPVNITVAAASTHGPGEHREWEGFTTHAQFDALIDHLFESRPNAWAAMTIAQKKAWLDENYD